MGKIVLLQLLHRFFVGPTCGCSVMSRIYWMGAYCGVVGDCLHVDEQTYDAMEYTTNF